MSSYRLSHAAQQDLVQIRDYIAQSNRTAAVDFIDRLITRFEQLAEQPLMGRSREDLRPGIRSSLIGGYLVLYRRVSDRIEIVRVIHGRRDLVSLF